MNYKNLFAVILILVLTSCSKNKPANLGINQDKLSPCPERPNCVSSVASNEQHKVVPLKINNNTWEGVAKIVSSLPNTHIVKSTKTYIHAESKSRVFGFIDDLELYYQPNQKIIHVRSAARTGYSDFSVNRSRVEKLRTLLIKKGNITSL